VNEYVGIYDEQWIQLHSIKIFANTKDEALKTAVINLALKL